MNDDDETDMMMMNIYNHDVDDVNDYFRVFMNHCPPPPLIFDADDDGDGDDGGDDYNRVYNRVFMNHCPPHSLIFVQSPPPTSKIPFRLHTHIFSIFAVAKPRGVICKQSKQNLYFHLSQICICIFLYLYLCMCMSYSWWYLYLDLYAVSKFPSQPVFYLYLYLHEYVDIFIVVVVFRFVRREAESIFPSQPVTFAMPPPYNSQMCRPEEFKRCKLYLQHKYNTFNIQIK